VPALVLATSLSGQLTDWVAHQGTYAVFLLMALDALVPANSEITMLFAGALAAGAIAGQHPALLGVTLHTGFQSYVALALAGTLGYLAGSLAGWTVGRLGGRPLLERHGRLLHLGPASVERAERWFARFGPRAVFFGRLAPVVRSFISIPAGAFGAPLPSYTLLTLAGSAIWCFGFAGAGWALGSSWGQFHHAFGWVELATVAITLLALGAIVARRTPLMRR
jgi:membrane protein DedA with SNARE-associated domain